MKTPIYDITKFTTVDYPDHLSAILWLAKCNMRCSYCYNPQIVNGNGTITLDDAIQFLKKRQGMLDGVVLSGGEATLQLDQTDFLEKIKAMSYSIKLDTNGLKPNTIKRLVEKNLIDYIALDYKAPSHKFTEITSVKQNEPFLETLKWLTKIDFPFEVRTTIHPDILKEEDINEIIKTLTDIGYKHTYYLQSFLDTGSTIGNLSSPTYSIDQKKISTAIPVQWR